MGKCCCSIHFLPDEYAYNIIIGDTQVGIGHIKNGDIRWGCTVILLQFLPNLVFILWFVLSHKGRLFESGTCGKILIAGSVQLVTLARYVWTTKVVEQNLQKESYSLHIWNIHHSLLFFSIVIGMIMAFRPNGIVVNGVLLRSDTASGNLNFYKGMEGFLESFPQAIYQISILLRSARQIGT